MQCLDLLSANQRVDNIVRNPIDAQQMVINYCQLITLLLFLYQ